MKARWLYLAMLITISLFCLMGLTNSQQQRLSVKVPKGPFDLPQGLAAWDWKTKDVSKLGEVHILDWDSVVKSAEGRVDKDSEYYLDQSEFEHLVRNNVFQFSRLGICTVMYLSVWDYSLMVGYRRWIEKPDAFTLAKILTDPKQDAAREEFMASALRVMKEPQTKVMWGKQRDSYCNMIRNDWGISSKDPEWIDYNRMLNADYESSMQMAFNSLIRVMNGTDFSLKVIPSGYSWELVRVINKFFDWVSDDSPLRIQSACYRMGPDATRKMIGYVERARDGFLK